MKHNRTVGLFVLYGLFAAASAIGQQVADDNSAEISIEAQRLDLALNELAQQSGFQLLTFAEDALDKTAKPLNGTLSDEQALDLLLEGTGLTYREVEEDVIAVGSPDRLSAKFPGNARPASNPALVAQNRVSAEKRKPPTQITANASSSTNDDNATSVVTGKVTDARTGANLKGAKVTIEETGQWTSTGDLGRFRFVNVPTGSVTLTVSFLGYATQTTVVGVREDSIEQSFSLRGGSEIEEIVVFGQRSARAIALNQERTANNVSTVVSADFLGNSAGNTISDVLRLAPGVAFVPDETTGEGTNIIVRGLVADLNSVKINGVQIGSSSGSARSANLSNILADSIDTVTISKSLLPSQDSEGIGAIVDITTKSPFDRPERFAQISAEYGDRGNSFGDDVQVSGVVSGTFGVNERFGLSVSVEYRDNEIGSLGYGRGGYNFGAYYPAGITSLSQIDPQSPFPFDDGGDQVFTRGVTLSTGTTATETLAINITGEYSWGNHTNLRLDWNTADADISDFSTTYTISDTTTYSEQPVSALGGELRTALQQLGTFSVSQSVVGRVSERSNEVLALAGNTRLSKWTFDYGVGYTSAKLDGGKSYSSDFLSFNVLGLGSNFIDPEAVDPVEGRVLSIFPQATQGGFPAPLLTEGAFTFLNGPDNYLPVILRRGDGSYSETERFSGNLSARFDVSGDYLDSIEFGGMYEEARFQNYDLGSVGLFILPPFQGTEPEISLNEEFGLEFIDTNFGLITGPNLRLLTTSPQSAADVTDQIISASATDDRFILDVFDEAEFNREQFTEEDEFAAYVQGEFSLGSWGIIAGVRYSYVEARGRRLSTPVLIAPVDGGGFAPDQDFALANTVLVEPSGDVSELLPRILANYRISDNQILRFGYGRSYGRPSISQISRAQALTIDLQEQYGPDGNQPRIIARVGNPNLKPSLSDNIDISYECYNQNGGVYKVQAYYKSIDGLIETIDLAVGPSLENVVLPSDPRIDSVDNFFVEVTQPQNNPERSEILGIELVAEQQFTWLPGAWGGLGVFANYNYADSSKDETLLWGSAPGGPVEYTRDVPFSGSPKHSGALGLTYNMYGFDTALTYYNQSEREIATFSDDFGFRRIRDSQESLDLSVQYRFNLGGSEMRLFFAGSDLLKSEEDAVFSDLTAGRNVPTLYDSESYIGGRSFRLGVAATF